MLWAHKDSCSSSDLSDSMAVQAHKMTGIGGGIFHLSGDGGSTCVSSLRASSSCTEL